MVTKFFQREICAVLLAANMFLPFAVSASHIAEITPIQSTIEESFVRQKSSKPHFAAQNNKGDLFREKEVILYGPAFPYLVYLMAYVSDTYVPDYENYHSGLGMILECKSDNEKAVLPRPADNYMDEAFGGVQLIGVGVANVTCRLYQKYSTEDGQIEKELLKEGVLKVTVCDNAIYVKPDNTEISGNFGVSEYITLSIIDNAGSGKSDSSNKLGVITEVKIKSDDGKIAKPDAINSETLFTTNDQNALCPVYFSRPGATNFHYTVSYSDFIDGVELKHTVTRTIPVVTRTPTLSLIYNGKKVKTISVSPSQYETCEIRAQITNTTGDYVSWTTSDPSVVDFTSTKNEDVKSFRAKKTGTAVIKASIMSYAVDSVIVNVVESQLNYKINLEKTAALMKVGESEYLQYQISPSSAAFENVVWSSSNPEVATVSKTGYIQSKKPGNTKITASLELNPSVSSVCDLWIYEPLKALPAELIATDGYTARWKEVPGAVSYRLYFGDNYCFKVQDTSVPLSAEAGDIDQLTYWFMAEMKNGLLTDASNKVKVKLLDKYPIPVANEKVKFNADKSITLSWSVPENTGLGWYVYIWAQYHGQFLDPARYEGESDKTITFNFSDMVEGFKFCVTSYGYLGEESDPSNMVYVKLKDSEDVGELDSVHEDEISMSVQDSILTISGISDDEIVTVYTMSGQCVSKSRNHKVTLASGMYLVQVRDQLTKIIVK